jgi:excisionase family DNA binding protein
VEVSSNSTHGDRHNVHNVHPVHSTDVETLCPAPNGTGEDKEPISFPEVPDLAGELKARMRENHQTRLEWLGLRQLTEYAAVSERTLRAWIHLPIDALPAVRVGGKVLIQRSQFDSWLGRHRIQSLPSVDVDAIVRELVER